MPLLPPREALQGSSIYRTKQEPFSWRPLSAPCHLSSILVFFWGEAAASHFDRFPFPIMCCSTWGLISSFVVSCNAVCYVLFCLMWDVTGLPGHFFKQAQWHWYSERKKNKQMKEGCFSVLDFDHQTDPHKELSLPGYLCRVIFSHMWVISAHWWEVIHLITIRRCPLPLDWGLR